MFVAGSGAISGSPTMGPDGPTFKGPQTLHIEPSAIPEALTAFRQALTRVERKVRDLQGLPIREWAGDPVSRTTAMTFTERTNGGDAQSAITCLLGYQKQLQRAVDSLEDAQRAYQRLEGDNAAMWGRYS